MSVRRINFTLVAPLSKKNYNFASNLIEFPLQQVSIMDKIKNLLKNCATIDEMLDRGDVEDAVRYSGELLAEADALWTAAHNDKATTIDEISALAILAAYHCDALAMMSNINDAYATAVTALFQMAIDGNESLSIDQSALQLYNTAIMSMMQILQQQMLQPDDASREHINEIMRYLASMLYHYYNKVGKARPNFPHLQVSYQILAQLQGSVDIQSPSIKVLNEEINPSTPLPLFSDLVGRSHAMGLINHDR